MALRMFCFDKKSLARVFQLHFSLLKEGQKSRNVVLRRLMTVVLQDTRPVIFLSNQSLFQVFVSGKKVEHMAVEPRLAAASSASILTGNKTARYL